MYSELCKHHHPQFWNVFITPKRNLVAIMPNLSPGELAMCNNEKALLQSQPATLFEFELVRLLYFQN